MKSRVWLELRTSVYGVEEDRWSRGLCVVREGLKAQTAMEKGTHPPLKAEQLARPQTFTVECGITYTRHS